jgi:addiction module RelE/StbE family toxin
VRKIRWTTEAADQFEATVEHILQDNPDAARSVARGVIAKIEQLVEYPALGRPGEINGTRELVIAPYVVVYRSTEETVEILHVWHGAQDWR